MIGALAFVSVEEWNGYPLGSYLFAHLYAARRLVWSSRCFCIGFEVLHYLPAASSDVAGASSLSWSLGFSRRRLSAR